MIFSEKNCNTCGQKCAIKYYGCSNWKPIPEPYKTENKNKRTIDADELLKRISEKAKIPSLSEDTVNGLCGATAIIYDMLIESGKEK